MAGVGSYLKKHTEALVKDVGIEPACTLTGKSKAILGRYYSDNEEHSDRFMPIDAVAALEEAASYPHVTSALADPPWLISKASPCPMMTGAATSTTKAASTPMSSSSASVLPC